MKTYFIASDIHAQYRKLQDSLNKSGFDLENPDHIFVFGGDALDRGTEGEKVIEFFQSLITSNRIIGVLGNHDKFLLDMLNGDISKVKFNMHNNGFNTTVQLGMSPDTFSLNKKSLINSGKNITKKYPVFVEWLKKLPAFLEFDKHVLVHAFLDFSKKDWHDTDLMYAIWERGFDIKTPETFTKKLIIGHTPNIMINGKSDIIYLENKILIDGGAAYGGKINILVLNEDEL